ncbi:13327_t:CDS:1, partial [Funneliformis geosporum]
GSTPIQHILPNEYRKLATHLRRMSLIFTEQLSTSDGNTMLTLFDLMVYQNSPQVGREPAWFNRLQTLLTVNITSRELRQKTPHIKNYYFNFSPPVKIARTNPYVL